MENYERLSYIVFERFARELGKVAEHYDPFKLITVYYLTTAQRMKVNEVAKLLGLAPKSVSLYRRFVRLALQQALNGTKVEQPKEVKKVQEVKKPEDKDRQQRRKKSLLDLL